MDKATHNADLSEDRLICRLVKLVTDLDLDRRDFLMLGAGLGGAVIAILVALGLVRLVRRPDPKAAEEPHSKTLSRISDG